MFDGCLNKTESTKYISSVDDEIVKILSISSALLNLNSPIYKNLASPFFFSNKEIKGIP